MDTKSLAHVDAAGVATRLEHLGLSEELLLDSVKSGIEQAFTCTRHDPPILPGLLAWGRTTRHLRDNLVPRGWRRSDRSNFATVISPEGIALVVAAGDSGTGRPGLPLSTRSTKGPITREAVRQNQLALDLGQGFPPPAAEPGASTWLLLHYVDEEAEEIRAELALPEFVSDNGYVSEWRERIILSPISMQPLMLTEPSTEDEEIEIAVERRAE